MEKQDVKQAVDKCWDKVKHAFGDLYQELGLNEKDAVDTQEVQQKEAM